MSETKSKMQNDPKATETDYYKLLGVEHDATLEQIKKGYKKMAVKYHPDKGGDAEIFKKVAQAYSVLSDPEKRKVYDEYGEEGLMNGGEAENYSVFDPFDLFSTFFGFSDSSHSRGKRHRSYQPEDTVQYIDCSLEELYKGETRSVPFTRQVNCKECRGKGCISGVDSKCKRCKGTGMETKVIRERNMYQQFQTTCSLCHGSGEYISQKNRCKRCNGNGYIEETNNLDVQIPRGGQNGEQIRIRNAGNEEYGSKAGDAVFIIREQHHPVYMRKDTTLYTKISISLAEALCGFSHVLTTLDQREILFTSPKGSVITPKSYKIIEGEGMPDREGKKGDLLIRFDIQFPESISPLEATELATAFHYQPKQTESDCYEQVDLKDVDMDKLKWEQSANESHTQTTFDRNGNDWEVSMDSESEVEQNCSIL